MGNVEATCINSRALFEKCTGSFIDHLNMQVSKNRDQLSIVLIQVRDLGEVTISLDRVRYLVLDKGPDLGGAFVDEIKATYLPMLDQPWPAGAEELVRRFKGLPDLVWFKIAGPTAIEAVCEEMSYDVNSRPRIINNQQRWNPDGSPTDLPDTGERLHLE